MVDPEMLQGLGLLLGGVITGVLSSRRLPFSRKEHKARNGNGTGHIRPSLKTGGALNISEEARGKLKELEGRLRDDYLTEREHGLLCDRNLAKLTNSMTEKLERKMDERFEVFEDKILNAISELME